LEYSLRPPHWFTITWRIVVNRDSLNKWLEWLNDLGTRSKANMDEYANKMDGVKDLYKSYMDSANHYVDLKANYMNLHYEEYTKALTAGDKTAIAAYEKGMAAYDNKMNAFVKKAGDLQKDPGAEKAQNNIQDERQKMSLIFRESTVLLIEFSFNPDRIVLSDCVPVKATPAIPGFKLLRWYDNPNPDLTLNLSTFLHSKNIAIGLLGGWNTIPDAKGDYSPLFRFNKTASDKLTPKKIKSDQLQSLCIYGSGNKSAIQKLFADLDSEELNKIIIKNE
jgi:hypothetical protein